MSDFELTARRGGQAEAEPVNDDKPVPPLTTAQWRRMAAASLHLYERLAQSDRQSQAAATPETLMAEWCEVAAAGDAEGFARRLAQDGLSRQQAMAAMSDAAWPADKPLPEWCGFLQRVFQELSPQDIATVSLASEDRRRYPFQQILQPLVAMATTCLQQRLDPSRRAWLPAALRDNQATLLRRLCHQASLALQLEFTLYLNRHESSLSRVVRRARGERSDGHYRAFIDQFYAGRWPQFASDYPVLARQLAECCLRWIDTIDELLQRWCADHEALIEYFPQLRDAGEPVSFELGQSDLHNGGRSTAFVHYASGPMLLYKPKPLHSDALVAELLAWISAAPGSLPMQHIRTLNCERYGWQEWIAHAPCATPEQIAEFYQRMGYLLALVYALEGYDYHHENLIAHGAMPVLVDTETIFNPYKEMERQAGDRADAASLAAETVFYSVIRTGFLPNWTVRDDGTRQDLSGLGGGGQQGNDPFIIKRWVDVDSDDIHLENVREAVKPRGNQPFVRGGEAANAEDYIAELRQGFAHVYELMLEQRHTLLEILRRHEQIPVRFVRKATRIYSDQLWRNLKPECLRDGRRWSLAVEQQSRMFVAANSNNHAVWGLLRAEYEALMALDIPYFKVPAAGLDIADGQGRVCVPRYFTRDCLTRLEEKIGLLNPRDRALQDRYIAYSFYARAAQSIHTIAPELSESHGAKQDTADQPVASADRCLRYAREIADELLEQALQGPDGSLSWVALEYLKEAEIFQLKPISYNLYSGSMGVALLLAALGDYCDEPRYREAAHATLLPLLRILREEQEQVVRLSGLGVGVGLGSLIYGLSCIAQFSEEARAAEYLKLATDCALNIDERQLRWDEKHDLIFGASGCLLAVDKLLRQSGAKAVLDPLRRLADHLLAQRQGEQQLVPTYAGTAVTGFSHGSAGVALALARAARHTGEAAYAEAAADHARFEESVYDSERGNYPDYRSRPDQPAFMTTWCHGAPGIGLSRLKHYQVSGDDRLLQASQRAMATANRFTLAHLDHTCCGNLGRLDIQWEFAQAQNDQAYQQALLRDLNVVLDQRERLGGFRLFLNAPTQVFSPGLFTGAAGIAYTLLRFAAPGRLPCVLAFD
ncbi:MAG: hypothetical protein Tsb002_19350 [Wenzhouxiangellaceae bacterium]